MSRQRTKPRSSQPADLESLPNVGPATAGDLRRLGITRPDQLAGREPEAMYDALCALDGARHDPCVRDVFAAIVAHAEGAPAQPWWAFTPARRAKDRAAARRGRRKDRSAA